MSPALRVLSPGLHTTIQDGGRIGFRHLGVPPSGALDPVALRLANALVGNPPLTAGLEMLRLGPSLEVEASSLRLAVVGGARPSLIRDGASRTLLAGRSHVLLRGDRLDMGGLDTACAVLAVAGGFSFEPVLGSFSTYVRAGIGPLGGRILAKGDALPLAEDHAPPGDALALPGAPEYGTGPIRVMAGPQKDRFTEGAWRAFLEGTYKIGAQSDRMGLRLDGPRLGHAKSADIPSDGLVAGSIQVPGDGQPIILLADHQTVGGYTKIATVITADLPRLGRSLPGTNLCFAAVTLAEARAARRSQEAGLAALCQGLVPVREGGLDLDALYGSELVSGMVDALASEETELVS